MLFSIPPLASLSSILGPSPLTAPFLQGSAHVPVLLSGMLLHFCHAFTPRIELRYNKKTLKEAVTDNESLLDWGQAATSPLALKAALAFNACPN